MIIARNRFYILFCTIFRHFCIFLSAIKLQSVTDDVRLLNGSSQFLSVYESQSQHLMANAVAEHSVCNTSSKLFSRFHLQFFNIMNTSTPKSRVCSLCEIIFNLVQIDFNWSKFLFACIYGLQFKTETNEASRAN